MNLINSLKVALYYKQNFATIPNKVGIENVALVTIFYVLMRENLCETTLIWKMSAMERPEQCVKFVQS